MNLDKRIFYLSFIMILIYSPISYAVGESNSNMGTLILKFFFYIFIIFGVIIITIYGTKFIAKNSKRFINSQYIKVLDRISLDTNTKITIVEINNYIYILAISNNSIETVDKIPKENFELEKNLKFENQLEWHKSKYIYKDSSKFKTKVGKFRNKLGEFFNKEDENDES